MMFKIYYQLTKPGIIYGNAITTIAGFFLAARGDIRWGLFMAALSGISFVIASACVFNNLMDRGIDSQMERTRRRALITGQISARAAVIFGGILILLGVGVLSLWTNWLALVVALVGFVVYVFLYTPLKRRSVYATLVGAVAGAVPPIVGYTAVTARLDMGAWILFLILVFWQMPHFYAIAIRRIDDYRAAGLPVLPVQEGIWQTKLHMLIFLLAFIAAAILLFAFKFAGPAYLTIALALGLAWLVIFLRGFRKNSHDDKPWAKRVFLFSLVVIALLSFAIVVDSLIK